MAASTHVAVHPRTASPVAVWHLLSLDAPTVATLWTCFIARCAGLHLPLAAPAAMFVAVWILYAADRLLDAAHCPAAELEARHLFHQRHSRAFLLGIGLSAVTLGALLPSLTPAAIRLYLLEGALLFAWFVILHATRSSHRLPKEIAVGVFFSSATFIPAVARMPPLRSELLPAAVLFGLLCTLNCLYIYAWEHEGLRRDTAHISTRIAAAHLPLLTLAAIIGGGVLVSYAPLAAKPIAGACSIAGLLLLFLHRNRQRLSPIDLRAAADIALLTPVLLFPFLR